MAVPFERYQTHKLSSYCQHFQGTLVPVSESQRTFKYLKHFVLYLEIHSDSVDSICRWLLLGTAAVSQSAEQVQCAALWLA